jgi:hypothetical protein
MMCFFNKMALALFARYDIPPWRGFKKKSMSRRLRIEGEEVLEFEASWRKEARQPRPINGSWSY